MKKVYSIPKFKMESLNSLTLLELKTFCKNNGIKKYTKYKRKELIEYIIKNIKIDQPSNSSVDGEENLLDKFTKLELSEKKIAISFIENLSKLPVSAINTLSKQPYLFSICEELKKYKLIKLIKEKIFSLDQDLLFSQEKINALSSSSSRITEASDILTSSFNYTKTSQFLMLMTPLFFEEKKYTVKTTHKRCKNDKNKLNIGVYYLKKIVGNVIEIVCEILTTYNADFTIDTVLSLLDKGMIVLEAFDVSTQLDEKKTNGGECSDKGEWKLEDFPLQHFSNLRTKKFLKIQGYLYFKKFLDFFDTSEEMENFYLRNMNETKVINKIRKLIFLNYADTKVKHVLKAFSTLFPKDTKYYPLDDVEVYHTDKVFLLQEQKNKLLNLFESGDLTALSLILPGRTGEFDFYQFREIKIIEEVINFLSPSLLEEETLLLEESLLIDTHKRGESSNESLLPRHQQLEERENFFSLPLLMMREVVYLNTLNIFKRKN